MENWEFDELRRQRGFLCIGGPAMFGGILSGISKLTEMPPWKIRIAFLLVAPLTGGFLGAGYLLCWLFVDKE